MEEEKREKSKGLWINKKDDKEYMSLACPECGKKLIGFPNKFKESDNQPDYNILVAKKQD
ncbi:hypothetical protein HN670_01515 [bacterium]|jgi:predicted RNA-binding Zn-ribbon protein involved in translation (DUF1610 family)|nr:hypothetical protein [bacterium]